MLVLGFAAAAMIVLGVAPDEPASIAVSRWEHAEIARIQRHFDGALDLLARRDLTTLSSGQRARRARLIDELRAYRDAAAFPRNRDFPGAAVPYFIDPVTGVRCAVAHLMEGSGGAAIVRRVAAADNNVWVAELAGDVPFRAWLEKQGLTLEEAARIQVPYSPEPMPDPTASRVRVGGAHYATVGTALGAAALNSVFAPARPSRTTAIAGAVVGVVAVGSGVSWMRPNQSREMGAASIVAGGLSVFLASRTFRQLRRQATPVTGLAAHDRTTLTPIIPVGGGQGFGASLSVRF